MKATNWEFKNRAMLFGMVFAFTFPLYALDSQNSSATLANWFAPRFHMNPDRLAQLLIGCGALVLVVAAFIRTWASAYLHAEVVYASEVKTQTLVADGPYRFVRNPLYLANALMAIALGAMMSRLGSIVAILVMLLFCYRLIFREEADLRTTQGDSYQRYCAAVPRLLPALTPRTASSGRPANWRAGFKAEAWYWGFAASEVVFAITLKMVFFFVILTASILLFWVSTALFQKKPKDETAKS
jgi:protein-S-isoprenylcysteine O-methyltransferase Ste14